jgi:hypothetical protein
MIFNQTANAGFAPVMAVKAREAPTDAALGSLQGNTGVH